MTVTVQAFTECSEGARWLDDQVAQWGPPTLLVDRSTAFEARFRCNCCCPPPLLAIAAGECSKYGSGNCKDAPFEGYKCPTGFDCVRQKDNRGQENVYYWQVGLGLVWFYVA